MIPKWQAISYKNPRRDAHVVPIADLREHLERRDCWCKPRLERPVPGAVMVVHNSMDGRELVEQHGIN